MTLLKCRICKKPINSNLKVTYDDLTFCMSCLIKTEGIVEANSRYRAMKDLSNSKEDRQQARLWYQQEIKKKVLARIA